MCIPDDAFLDTKLCIYKPNCWHQFHQFTGHNDLVGLCYHAPLEDATIGLDREQNRRPHLLMERCCQQLRIASYVFDFAREFLSPSILHAFMNCSNFPLLLFSRPDFDMSCSKGAPVCARRKVNKQLTFWTIWATTTPAKEEVEVVLLRSIIRLSKFSAFTILSAIIMAWTRRTTIAQL